MEKRIMILLIVFCMGGVLTGCINGETAVTTQPTRYATSAPTYSFAPTQTPIPTPTPTPPPTRMPTPSLMPTPTPPRIAALPAEDKGAAHYADFHAQMAYMKEHIGSKLPFVEERCARITAICEQTDGQMDILFDYVDWLTGAEAEAAYLVDFPGAQEKEYAFIKEIGYIRNVNPVIRTFRTCSKSRYYISDVKNKSTLVEVNEQAFRNWLMPLLSSRPTVMVCAVDGVIARVESIDLP